MEWLREATFWLVVLASLYPAWAKRTGRPILSSIPEECENSELTVGVDQTTWVVSPGHQVPGVVDGSQQVCKWSIKAPPGHGIKMEVVRFRLRRSRRCNAAKVQILPGLSVPRQGNRPLARFCGRGPRTKSWTTTFSEIDIEYSGSRDKDSQGSGGKDIQNDVLVKNSPRRVKNRIRSSLGSRRSSTPSSRPRSESTESRAEKLERIKALQRYYQVKEQEQEQTDPQRYQQRVAQGRRQFYRYRQSHDRSSNNNRRFYRHSNITADNLQYDHDNETLLVDGDRFEYDEESHVYGSVSVHQRTNSIRLFNVGEPAWINSNFIIHDGLNITETEYEEYMNALEELTESSGESKKRKKKKKSSRKKSKKNKTRQSEVIDLDQLAGDSAERIPREARTSRRSSSQGNTRRSYHRTRYYTVSRGRPRTSRKQYRVTIARHDQPSPSSTHSPPPRRALDTGYSRGRERNEIIPQKPTKPRYPSGSKEIFTPSKTFGYNNPKLPTGEEKRPSTNKYRKREFFVFKMSAFRITCGGEITEDRGRFTSPGYPQKTGGKNSCLWKFQTPAESTWKLQCTHFRVRKSPKCRRDHLAIRINDVEWTRYCGREGPSLTLTSSHSSKVDVALNTFRNSSARTICSWETTGGGGKQQIGYHRYWSYNLTRIPVTTPAPTTTTTTTTLPPPPLIPHSSWRCTDYEHLTTEHTMCRPTPPTCAIYQEGLSIIERQQILVSHNTYRAKVARGEEAEGLPGPQYSASDMQQLSWNDELARVAQAWASACPDYHDCHDCRRVLSRSYYVGQNIFYEWSSSNPGSVWETAVRLWYEEVKYVPNHLIKNFRMMDHAVIGHYTQLVWADTKEIGCGAAYHDCSKEFRGRSWKLKCKIYVCNYGPTGNYVRKPMYTIGPAASACPEGSTPSPDYPGLCTSYGSP